VPERAGATRRLFFALWPDAAIAERLHELAKSAHVRCGGRLMRLDTLHATLAFLGDIPEERCAAAIAAADSLRGEQFDLVVDRLGFWRNNHILWAGSATPPPALVRLADELGRLLRDAGFSLDARAFALHVTLLRKALCPASAGEAGEFSAIADPVLWPVRDFALVESHLDVAGARYEVLRRWPLGAPIG
jgi:2'-5' RNA ligase